SDRYSLAVVAFELLTGRRPFAGDTPTAEAFAHLNASIPRAVDVDPTLPLALDAVFEAALAKDPAARPATAHELVRRLRDAFGEATEPPTRVIVAGAPTRRLVRHEHRSRRRRGVPLALAALALLVAGLAAALVAGGDDFGLRQTQSAREAARSPSGSATA